MDNKEVIRILERDIDSFKDADYKQALSHAIEVMKASEWILCSEKMPNEGHHVLVDGGVAYYCGRGEWRSASNNYIIEWDVTHWMPLPQPPKGGE